MQTCEFTAEELEILCEVLKGKLTGIDIELFRTDTHDFKEMLKHRKAVMEKLLDKLSAAPVTT